MVHQLRLKYDSGLTVNELNLKMSQQCAAMKANFVFASLRLRDGIITLYWAFVRVYLECWTEFCPPSSKQSLRN